MTDLGDDELLSRWRGGDRVAGNALFARHFDAVHRFFANKVPGEAADLTQRTFLGCLESASRFRGDASFRTFLFAIARNELLAFWRRRGRQPELDPTTSSIADLEPSASTLLRRNEAAGAIVAALQRLPMDLQIALELHYVEQLAAHEIGTVLDVPEGTVKSRLRRAREMLREQLGDPPSVPDQVLDRWAAELRASGSR